ncbi:hypothetical protein AHF37_03137 [Paragonimus kellicotti]|nr:hypothetical protein AHF37_03137 [Paragonimus kellicotti]
MSRLLGQKTQLLSAWPSALYNLMDFWITYSLPRFGIYEVYKNTIGSGKTITFYEQLTVAGFSGFIGGLCGQPADLLMPLGYDQWKAFLLWTGYFEDVPSTHLCAGVGAAGAAVLLTQPFDVMKTRMQNAPKGHYSGLLAVAKDLMLSQPPSTTTGEASVQTSSVAAGRSISLMGFTTFFKGITPAFIRIGPHTILLFLFKEQLTIHFGFKKPVS